MPILPSQRQRFDIPDEIAYLNCAYMSPLSKAVLAAASRGLDDKRQPWKLVPADFYALTDRARATFARFLGGGAKAEDVALVPAASYGMATAAANLPLARGQRVLTLADEFPSTILTWRERARAVGAEHILLPRPADHDWTAAICEAIDERTAVAALSALHWFDGALIDLVRVRRRLSEVGATLALDLTQSMGTGPFDLDAIAPDFLVVAGYKWMMAPYSTGFLYVAPRWQGGRPIEHHWFGRADSQNFAALTGYPERFQPGALRFDAGEPANFALVPGLIAAVEQIEEWGLANIADTCGALADQIAARGAELGLTSVPTSLRARHYIGLRAPRGLPSGLAERLARANVFVSVRGGQSLRITPHVYNTQRDVDRLFEVLAAALPS